MASYGSVYQEGKNPHKYRIQFYHGKKPNGRPKKYSTMITANGNTDKQRRKDAERQLAEFREQVLSNNYIKPGRILLKDFIHDWKEKYAIHKLSNNTVELYELQIENRIIPALGHYHLEEITPFIIQCFLNDMKKDGARRDGRDGKLSGGSINTVLRALKSVINIAVEWKFITENPVKVKREKETMTAGNVYEKDEISQLLKCLTQLELDWRLFFHVAVTCGLRKGELMGLQWEDVDLDEGVLHVRHSLSFSNKVENGFILKETKSGKERDVYLPQDIIPLFKRFREKRIRERQMLADLWEGGEYFFVFGNEFGKPYSKRYPLTKWERFTKRNGLKEIRLHDLRHTHATYLLKTAKVDLATVSTRLGHYRASFTADVYAHSTKESDKKASATFVGL